LSGFEFGSDALNPYRQFNQVQPTALIQGGVLVFDGRFPVARASALSFAQKSWNQMAAGNFDQALAEATSAVATDPDCIDAEEAMGDALAALHRTGDARASWQAALALAQKLEPGAREGRIARIERKLAGGR
jgi:tetratricopeptide (TPR) repeat protein